MKDRARLLAALGLTEYASKSAIIEQFKKIPDLATRAHAACRLFGEDWRHFIA